LLSVLLELLDVDWFLHLSCFGTLRHKADQSLTHLFILHLVKIEVALQRAVRHVAGRSLWFSKLFLLLQGLELSKSVEGVLSNRCLLKTVEWRSAAIGNLVSVVCNAVPNAALSLDGLAEAAG
jgi:hypothetical protein